MNLDSATSMRTHLCGELRPEHAGLAVTVCGWVARRREHGEHLAFVDVRDHLGVVQCVVDNSIDVRSEYVVRVTGTVRARPEGTVNPNLPTGDVEIGDCTVEVLRTAAPPPFPIDARADDVDEVIRLQYRYLDLRRERMQRNLRVRAAINSAVRRAMEAQGFVEVETPMLVPSTPEGAREFLVPSRKEPGSFYALPQSPQLFKQLLMVAGFDRYYQIARCLRDEDLRADRQYEFMQLDAEMSFVGQDDVLAAISEAVLAAAEAATGERPPPIERITWHESMNRFGVDKPDLRFGIELVELTDAFGDTAFKAFAGAAAIKAIRVPGAAAEYGRNQLDKLTDRAKALGAKGLVWLKVAGDGSFDSPVAKFLSPAEAAAVSERTGAEPGDLLLLVADDWATACEVLGQLRNDLGRPPVHEGPYRYVWVVDFPMFVGRDEHGRPKPGHHPFTMPHPDDVALLATDPMAVRSQAYDLVLNGWELGSGSIRIHETALQKQVFAALGITDEAAMRKFGFFLNPFEYGAPPHGGFAFGLDRLVAILAGEENIREVIAFPKTQSGADPMTESPLPVDPAQLAELGIRVLPRSCDMDPAAWNARYSADELVWSAEPNRFLPPEVAGLPVGRALDLACGEGRNAIWLARQGWHVVAVDFAEAGIAKGRRLAADAGVDVEWVVADVTTYDPERRFDLVIVFYLQLVAVELDETLRRAAAACGPGGTLLLVGHHVDNLERGYGGPTSRAVLHDPDVIAATLAGCGLEIVRAEMVERPVDTDAGPRVALDALVRALA